VTYWEALREVVAVGSVVAMMCAAVVLLIAPFVIFGPWGLIASAILFVPIVAFILWRYSKSIDGY
jgi:uncharacterized sodium:solute symporter family permease YidK